MKFSINSKTLLKKVSAAKSVISNKVTIPALSMFLFELKDSELTITAADHEHLVKATVSVEDAESDGAVCVDAKRVTDILKSMPDCQLRFALNEKTNELFIYYPNGKFKIAGVGAENYPLRDEPDGSGHTAVIRVSAPLLLSAFDKVGFAVETDEFRPVLQGMLFDVKDGSVTFAGTDTHKLAVYSVNAQVTANGGADTCQTIVHARSFPVIKAFLATQTEVEVFIAESAVTFRGNGFLIRATPLHGRFPDYSRVIPQSSPNTVVIDRAAFLNAVNRVSLCADEAMNLLRLKFTDGNVVIGSGENYSNAEAEESMPCNYSGEEITIGFKADYIKGILGVVASRDVELKLTSPERPAVLTPVDDDEVGNHTLLCIPLVITNT